jgi:hypothetical protein
MLPYWVKLGNFNRNPGNWKKNWLFFSWCETTRWKRRLFIIPTIEPKKKESLKTPNSSVWSLCELHRRVISARRVTEVQSVARVAERDGLVASAIHAGHRGTTQSMACHLLILLANFEQFLRFRHCNPSRWVLRRRVNNPCRHPPVLHHRTVRTSVLSLR